MARVIVGFHPDLGWVAHEGPDVGHEEAPAALAEAFGESPDSFNPSMVYIIDTDELDSCEDV